MPGYRIAAFEGRPHTICNSGQELLTSLSEMGKGAFPYPTLVNVYSDSERGAIIGLGAPQSTLQLVDKRQGVTHRAVSEREGGDSLEFAYQGEATFVRPRFSIPQEQAILAVVAWLTNDELSENLKWISGECPPSLS